MNNNLDISYMIEKIQKRINSNFIILNKFNKDDHTHNFLNSLTRVLQNEGFPNPHSTVKIVCMEYLKNIPILQNSFVSKLEAYKKKLLKIKPFLNNENLQKYEYKIIKSKKRLNGVIGGHLSNIKIFPKYFVKRLCSHNMLNEAYIYYLAPKIYPKLASYMIKCHGIIFAKSFDDITKEKLDYCRKFKKFNSKELIFIPFKE